jgi:hypothetical protein
MGRTLIIEYAANRWMRARSRLRGCRLKANHAADRSDWLDLCAV